MRWLFGMALAWAMILGGLVFLWFALTTRLEAADSDNWPSTRGRVIESFVTSEEVTETTGRHSSRTRTYYTPVVRYEYAVDGLTYSGDRIAIEGKRSTSAVIATGVASDYPDGSEVTVYYNPDRPEQTVLEAGMPWGSTILLTLGGLVIGGCGLFFHWLGRYSPYRPAWSDSESAPQKGQRRVKRRGRRRPSRSAKRSGRNGEDAARRVSPSTNGAGTERDAHRRSEPTGI